MKTLIFYGGLGFDEGHGFSPDLGDALALTFAENIRRDARQRPRVACANTRYDPLRWRVRA